MSIRSNADVVTACAFYGVPNQLALGHTDIAGRRKARLVIGNSCCLGRIISLRHRRHLNRKLSLIFFERITGGITHVDLIGLFARNDFHDIRGRVFHFIPNDFFLFCIYCKAGRLVEVSAVYERLRLRIHIPRSHRAHGKGNSALLHLAVSKIEVGGISVVEFGMIVFLVAAIDSDNVFFRILHGVKYEDGGLGHLEKRNSRQCFIFVIDGGRLAV